MVIKPNKKRKLYGTYMLLKPLKELVFMFFITFRELSLYFFSSYSLYKHIYNYNLKYKNKDKLDKLRL